MANPTQPKKILLAEDVRAISLRVSHALETHGYLVRVAEDGEECLEQIEEFKPDLLVLDLIMPKMNGLEVLRQLRSQQATQHLPVIVTTAKDYSTELKHIQQTGPVDVLIKPFDPELLLGKLQQYFHEAATARGVTHRSHIPTAVEQYAPVLNTKRPHVRLWGTRGSIPVCGARYAQHGGNTTCFEYSTGKERIMFDAGSGLREAGLSFLAGGPCHVHLFVTHTHWDHIQGFPFFTPIYVPGFEITVYGERGFGKNIESLLCGQMDRDYFPIQREDLRAKINFVFLDDEPVKIGDVTVTREFTQHPGATVGFKVQHEGRSVVFMPDNEFLQGYTGSPALLMRDTDLVVPYEPILKFLDGVDLLVHEAQYLPTDYPKRIGWGHSNLATACAMTKLTGVKKWIVVHHDPDHDDPALHSKLNLTRQILREIGHPIEVVHGYDGMSEYL
jgi:CheY-like chemotaxis protein/phosphoribosyl 1,2-cyclic phosphodiesterase